MKIRLPESFIYTNRSQKASAYVKNGILYVEGCIDFEDLMYTITYVLKGYDKCHYLGVNVSSDRCFKCGYVGEMESLDETNNHYRCPQCGNPDQAKMNVARRTCGYIGTQYWNQGRTQEIKDRVLHL